LSAQTNIGQSRRGSIQNGIRAKRREFVSQIDDRSSTLVEIFVL
jgi:hypothetical protein